MLILMGPSASGKTEVAKILEKNFNLKKVVTHTTRKKRIHEKNHIDYHFVSKNDFISMQKNNEFVETTNYNDNFYGTSKKEISDNKCLILDPKGAEVFYNLNDSHIFIVYLTCKEEIRYQRMIYRLDEIEIIKKRIESDRITFSKRCNEIANVTVKSSNIDLYTLSNKIYKLYTNYLTSLK